MRKLNRPLREGGQFSGEKNRPGPVKASLEPASIRAKVIYAGGTHSPIPARSREMIKRTRSAKFLNELTVLTRPVAEGVCLSRREIGRRETRGMGKRLGLRELVKVIRTEVDLSFKSEKANCQAVNLRNKKSNWP